MWCQGISAVAIESGLTPRAVRFYEQRGLIAARRDRYNQRYYDVATRRDLSIIVDLRRAGLGLDDIRAVLEARREGPIALRGVAQAHLAGAQAEADARLQAIVLARQLIERLCLEADAAPPG